VFGVIFLVILLVAVPLLSLRYGVDSRHLSDSKRSTNW
jgi:hypothetical protein